MHNVFLLVNMDSGMEHVLMECFLDNVSSGKALLLEERLFFWLVAMTIAWEGHLLLIHGVQSKRRLSPNIWSNTRLVPRLQ